MDFVPVLQTMGIISYGIAFLSSLHFLNLYVSNITILSI